MRGNEPFLIESALLTHGLRSLTNEQIVSEWCFIDRNIAWVDGGKIVCGDMREFLVFRDRCAELSRIDCDTLDAALQQRRSGALTASGTMAVCAQWSIPLAVTCGMGGIGDIRGEELCPDLPAVSSLPVALVSTAPKDMLDVPATIAWLRERDVLVLGARERYCTGYIFHSTEVALSGTVQGLTEQHELLPLVGRVGLLILNPIPEQGRIRDLEILWSSILVGKAAESRGEYYHPAVNEEIDRRTNGYSSRLQLHSLLDNVRLAQTISNSVDWGLQLQRFSI